MTELHAWFHVYADGNWRPALDDYLDALQRFGLHDALTELHIGFHGCPDNIERVETYLRLIGLTYTVEAREDSGWEQVTLSVLHEWCQSHDGYVSYAHTKGAGFDRPIQEAWRRGMLFNMIVRWEACVAHLDAGAKVVGSHYRRAEPSITDPAWGWSGMFCGNFWWTKADVLRLNVPPTYRSRLDAEHWLFQLTEVMDVSEGFVVDLNPADPADAGCHPAVW